MKFVRNTDETHVVRTSTDDVEAPPNETSKGKQEECGLPPEKLFNKLSI